MDLPGILLGRRLANREIGQQKIGILAGIAALGLDGLASSAYGPEAALAMLISLGAGGTRLIGPIMLAILVLLAILCLSYRQTIEAYPVNGGSYTVAKENLGMNIGIVAAAALLIDYVLNVAVGISAGVAALVSALPGLHSYTLPLCLAVLGVITLANLRGLPEASTAFAIPTYFFIACLGFVLALGVVRAVMGGSAAAPVVAPPALPSATEAAGLWIALRAFASGCTAMTGVEAVSNGVSAFREPTVPNARRTLTGIVVILSLLLAGIAYLSRVYHIGAMDQTGPGYQSVLSQLTGAVVGRGPMYFMTIAGLLAVLCLSANTSFVDFPRVCRLLARDDLLPRGFAIVGRRLVNSVGILILATGAGLLLIVFGGITEHLIPLFAVGAFLAFTLSQAGMANHWRRAAGTSESRKERVHQHLKLSINALGAICTGFALLIIIAAKFLAGAWIVLVVLPLVVLLLRGINQAYRGEARLLHDSGPLAIDDARAPLVLVPIDAWDRLAEKALKLALRLSPDVVAVHLIELTGPEIEEYERGLRRAWARNVESPARAAEIAAPRLILLRSPLRRFVAPLMGLIADLQKKEHGRPIAVLIPELMRRHWWQSLLHVHRGRQLRAALLRAGGAGVVAIDVPLHLEAPPPRAPEAVRPERDEQRAVLTALGRHGVGGHLRESREPTNRNGDSG